MGVLDRFMCMPFMGCNRQVDTFDRRQCGLERVPEEIKAYKNTLEELLLDENLFDKLPEFLFTLHKLRILGLSGNKLTEISHDISKLTNLEDLNLHENELFAFPTGIFLCRQLRVFDISKNHIIQLPSEITQLTSLTHLNLNDISLATLPADIGHLYNLRSFEIRENFIKTLPPSVGCLTKLERLDIGQNEIYHLPIEIGGLVSLVEFYADENLLTEIPEEISCCQALEQLDVSQNKLLDLPETLGDLSKLTDLAVAQNSLTQFPASIGKLSKLQHLKAEKNDLNVLTPGIARCRELAELHLSENRLAELPSALGNLSKLKVLIVDKNELRSIPSQLGSCGSMTILSIRSNEIRELPMEIGKLSNLTVLDVSNNKLSFLPFTISVLGKLSAIWLDEGQSQGMVKLCEGRDPKTNMKVMTCYLLPQRANGQGDDNRRQPSTGFTDGPRVHFGEEDEPKESIGNFERQNTPHPKPQGQKTKSKKGGDDVHLVPNEVQQNGKPLPEPTPQPMPRSALKKPTANGTEQPSTSSLNQSMTQSATQQFNPSLTKSQSDLVSMSRGSASIRISITKDPSGMGLSIAGGLESEPYKENDSGIFVSKVIPGGAGQKAGLKVGDRIIGVNGFTAINANHKEIVEYMKNSINVIVLDILRDLSSNVEQVSTPLVRSPDQSFNTSIDNSRPEKHTYIITRDSHGSPGFSIVGGQGSTNEENIIVSHVSYGSQAEKRGMRVGDQIVSINNTNVRKIRHDQAVSLLTGSPGDEVIIATERDRSIVSPVTSPITTPLPPVLNVPFGRVVSPQSLLYGDPSWDNKTEQVDLYRPTGSSLGLSVVGGSDVCSHPFGKGNHGAFVSKIIPNSPAGSCGRLRLGDRILNVNNKDLKNAKHEEVINTMKSSGNVIKLGVLHEPQPQGLKEVFFTRTDPDKLGLYICGGTDAPPANPNVANDDGIFIDKIDIHSCCFGIKDLYPGVRILEVNDDSLLGCTQVQAAEYLKKAGHRIRLLICQGYTKSTTPTPEPQISPSTNTLVAPPTSTIPQNDGLVEEKKILITDASSSLTPPTLQTPASHLHNNLDNDIEDAVPLNTSTPIPPPAEEAIPKLITKIPPPVAPKPSVNISAQEDPHQFSLITNLEKPPKVIDSSNYDSVASFSSKLKKFESESNGSATTILNTKKSTYSTIPSKKPLLTQDEVKKIKEEELRKMQDINFTNQNQFPSPIAESTFDQYVSKIPQPVNGLTKTKKVENNLTQVPNGFSEPVDSITQKRLDIQRNIEFRQARLKDTDSDEVFAQSAEVLNSFSRITSRMENRSEAGSIPSTPIPGH